MGKSVKPRTFFGATVEKASTYVLAERLIRNEEAAVKSLIQHLVVKVVNFAKERTVNEARCGRTEPRDLL